MPDATAVARRIADEVIAYGLSELFDLLPDGCVPETIADDSECETLTAAEQAQVEEAVYEHLRNAKNEFRRAVTHA